MKQEERKRTEVFLLLIVFFTSIKLDSLNNIHKSSKGFLSSPLANPFSVFSLYFLILSNPVRLPITETL